MEKNIILDLDNTLICNNVPRPFLRDFLKFIFEKFSKVCIWTSATKEWLNAAYINILKPNMPNNKEFYFMWDREHCYLSYSLENNITNIVECYKQLNLVYIDFPDFSQHNTIIVDDKSRMFLKNYNNGILIDAFEENKMFDFELYRLTIFLYKEILFCKDIREIEKINWKMRYNVMI